MKKIYLLAAILGLGLGLSAQETGKKATVKKSKTVTKTKNVDVAVPVKAVPAATPAVAVSDAASANDLHAGHNHGAVATSPAVAPTVDMAKPVGEDNLSLKEMTFDFGKIPQGKPVTHDFAFTNSGKTDLKLDNVQAGCGCTTPTWKPGPYKAGESAMINVGFNAGAVGPFSKTVTITYNGGLSKVINFTGEVLAAPATPAPENKSVQILKGN